ncbi:hypothetical protein BX666DRAFT_2032133 [Dichotomocladium elegans]|nr:hypothetical protein BX666DRAFT_2032133 [Dichotomocladium elegans]
MAPVVLFESHSSSYNGTQPWAGLWNDILNALRHHPPRTSPGRINKIEPLKSDLISPSRTPTPALMPLSQPEPDLLDSKFQVEYVSFPRLVEDEAISKDEDTTTTAYTHDKLKKVVSQRQEDRSTIPSTPNNLGGSRRRLLGTPWMF